MDFERYDSPESTSQNETYYAEGGVYANPYANQIPPRNKRWVKWVIIGGVLSFVVIIAAIVGVVALSMKLINTTYDISDKDLIIDAASDELDMEMEKIDKDEAEDFIGHDVKKCYYGIEEDDDVLMSIIWAEFDDEYEATAYFKSQVDELSEYLDDYEDEGRINRYSWSKTNKKFEFSYIDEELSEYEDYDVKTKTLIVVYEEYLLAFTIQGDADEVSEMYDAFVEQLK